MAKPLMYAWLNKYAPKDTLGSNPALESSCSKDDLPPQTITGHLCCPLKGARCLKYRQFQQMKEWRRCGDKRKLFCHLSLNKTTHTGGKCSKNKWDWFLLNKRFWVMINLTACFQERLLKVNCFCAVAGHQPWHFNCTAHWQFSKDWLFHRFFFKHSLSSRGCSAVPIG